MTARPIRLLLGFFTVGSWTMASRILGFGRDILIAALLGAGPVAEAFFVAFRLPNMFRRFFAEGAFNMAFVPLFAKKLEGEGQEAAWKFGTEALSALAAVLLIFTVIAQIAMPWFVYALASGYSGADKFDLAVLYSRIVFPYIFLISLAALFSGLLNSFGRFAAAAAAPLLLNVALILALTLAWAMGFDVGLALACGALIGGFAQLGLLWWAAHRLGMGLVPGRPRLTPDVRRLITLAIPAVLAGGVMQINLVVGTQVASYFDGAVSWLWLADRVYQLPLGVIGVAIGVVLLPELSRRLRADDIEGTRESMNRATEFTMILIAPATVGLVIIPELIVSVLYERGAFTAVDTANTALALAVYALGLPSFVLTKVVQPAFFARENTKTPLKIALISMVVNIGFAIGLAPVVGFLAAAIGATLAGWANLILLWFGARRLDPDLRLDDRLSRRLPRIILASILMGAVVLCLAIAGEALIPDLRWLVLLVTILAAMIIYAGLAIGLGAFRLSDVRAGLRRNRGS
ncbi:MAG: murein biosynthesis integral membrane protein MurJ [Pseudomonadota bacterium]